MAATQHVYISATGVYSSTSSWDTSQIPGAGGAGLDTAIWDGTSNHDVIGETPGGNGLARIVSKPAYKGDIGAPGNPLVLDVNSPGGPGKSAVFRGRGNVYFKGDLGNFVDVTVDTGTQDRVVSMDGSLRHVFVKSGKVELVDTVAAIIGVYVLSANSHVTIAGNSAVFGAASSLVIRGGIVDSKEDDWPRIEMAGGRLIQRGLMKDGCDVTMHGGWLEYNPSVSVANHNPDLHLFGGTLDLRNLTEDFEPADIIRGPGMIVLGNLLGQGGPDGLGGINVQIDLGEDYP